MRVPGYCHQQEWDRPDRAYVKLNGKRIQLGEYDSRESREKYDQLIAEWLSNHRMPAPAPAGTSLLVEEIVARFWLFAEEYYRGSGELGINATRSSRSMGCTAAATHPSSARSRSRQCEHG